MPIWFGISIFCATVAVGAALVAFFSRNRSAPPQAEKAAGLSIIAAILAGIFSLVSSVHTVPTKNVGIVTQFNKHTGANTGAGLKWTAPWQKVEDWNASRQSYDHLDEKTCVQVRIVGLQTACVEVLIEWQVKPDRAPEQWANYRKSFDYFTSKRVVPNITDSLNAVFREHDPIANVDSETAVIKPVDTRQYIEPTRTDLSNRIGDDINVLAVTFGFIHYNEATQKTIEAFQSKVMEARNLQQDEKNAETRARITGKNSARDKQAWCLEIAEEKGKEPGFCLGGGNPTQVTGGR